MLKTILVAGAALAFVAIALVLILAAMKPDTFQVRRSIAIDAPPERIYPLIADFKAWGAWSPWEKKDPALKRSLSGAESGVGARYAWDGDKNVGRGSMEIVEAQPSSKIALKLDFIAPFEAHNDVVFSLQPEGRATTVTWTMIGPTPFLGKVIHVFMDMDRMVGGDFEAGLAAMKTAAERPA
ncbi:polyketide cyclase [Bosea sp. Root381]|uniref:SRPBCC family protein n=1 Tax=Bosea sp. Root381 TaxID=1736524 RepID=UPI0007006C22|nr:SRPBCC family protein [Bosea sp. Root381]KRE11322.1 polyketide cyclase [Bosea sp. Root381]